MKADKANSKQSVTTYFKDNMGILIAFAVLYLFLAITPQRMVRYATPLTNVEVGSG